jgi:hypothetical protein
MKRITGLAGLLDIALALVDEALYLITATSGRMLPLFG